MIVPAERFLRVGPLDPGYFMYWEDADWCRRAHNQGLRVRYEPALCVRHTAGSSARTRPLLSIWAFHVSAFRYYRIHADASVWRLSFASVALAARGLFRLARQGVSPR
jgi:N-acetylglucosaminyl-diphospho-decaprenol L-rhamnosyltransferase